MPTTSDASRSHGPSCYGPFTMPGGRPTDNVYDAVTVTSRTNISCTAGLRIGAQAYSLPGLKIVFGPQFGGGGYGGPFRVGGFHCYLHSRGSDFRLASCQRGDRIVRFYDHRQYWSNVFYAFPGVFPTISRSGYCWTGSLTANRNDAWRCFVGNLIYDPCFSSDQMPGAVICPNPWLTGGIEIQLTQSLPSQLGNNPPPSTNGEPWNIQLTNGQHCTLVSGASSVVEGKRLNYVCTGASSYGLWGFPDRHSEPWTILGAPFTATHLHDRRAISILWY
ncbi:MAG: hypothetical protein JO042_14585 [Sinobacteraceae bacterium]|nr:hypothetical protein [Nevskiaceae bacterium]